MQALEALELADKAESKAVTLVELNLDQGITLVLVTHDNDLAQRMNRQVYLADGRIVDADGDDVDQPLHRSRRPFARPRAVGASASPVLEHKKIRSRGMSGASLARKAVGNGINSFIDDTTSAVGDSITLTVT